MVPVEVVVAAVGHVMMTLEEEKVHARLAENEELWEEYEMVVIKPLVGEVEK